MVAVPLVPEAINAAKEAVLLAMSALILCFTELVLQIAGSRASGISGIIPNPDVDGIPRTVLRSPLSLLWCWRDGHMLSEPQPPNLNAQSPSSKPSGLVSSAKHALALNST